MPRTGSLLEDLFGATGAFEEVPQPHEHSRHFKTSFVDDLPEADHKKEDRKITSSTSCEYGQILLNHPAMRCLLTKEGSGEGSRNGPH